MFGLGSKSKIVTDEVKIDEVLSRAVVDILPSTEELKKKLVSGERIRLYQGFDPTGTELHIGHMVGLRKLAQFQELGHEVIFLVGDGTGQAGDPTDKLKSRDGFLSREDLKENAKTYLEQAKRIIKFDGDNPVQLKFNGDWLEDLKLRDILGIAEHFTLQQLSERDMFRVRMEKGEPVSMREFLYPLLQGYDSVHMDVDLEIGATDQLFNMLAGRTLQKVMNKKNKFVLTTPLLEDSSGKKIGKTEGNVIAIESAPDELFGQIMSLGDDIISNGLEYLTSVPMSLVEQAKGVSGGRARELKKKLAFEVVASLNDKTAAELAKESFEGAFEKGGEPTQIKKISGAVGKTILESLVEDGVVESRTELRRLVDSGAISDTDSGEKITDPSFIPDKPITIKIGKHRFRRLE